MSKVFRFIYDSEYVDDTGGIYPEATMIEARHYFAEETTWPKIVWEFAKFLENTGYHGVLERIIIKDPHGIEYDCGFQREGEVEE